MRKIVCAVLLTQLCGCASFTVVGPAGYVRHGDMSVWSLGFALVARDATPREASMGSASLTVNSDAGGCGAAAGPNAEWRVVVPTNEDYINRPITKE